MNLSPSKRGIFGMSFMLLGIFALFFVPWLGTNLFENLDANEIMVIQAPFSGDLKVYKQPGTQWQGFGKVTKYPLRASLDFSRTKNADHSKRIRFNDGGHATLSGNVQWEMPLDDKNIIALHRAFGSYEGVNIQAVEKMIDLSVYISGPLMSSTESSGERRAELVQYINDQASNGIYETHTKMIKAPDPITGSEKTTAVVEIAKDSAGQFKRQQGSTLSQFGIRLLPVSINEINYDKVVEDQIRQRQEATTQVQIAQANARRAEQDALTTAKQGEANAAKAKWEQETIKAKEVTLAQQKLEVAKLGAMEAEQFKRGEILRGEGEAGRKRLVMEADGALDPKLAAWVEVNGKYADSIAKYQGNWVPTTVFGGGNTSSASGAQALVDMLTAKTARDLALDMSLTGKTTKK